MDLDLVRQVINLVEQANISELEVEQEGLRIVVKKHNVTQLIQAPPQPVTAQVPAQPQPEEAATPEEPPIDLHVITSPMVGTFYRAPSSEDEPFVKVGDTVNENTVVCILEAMKVMNELKAGTSGQITAILVENGQPVEYGQPLFHVRIHQ